jgi:hypothetical protein
MLIARGWDVLYAAQQKHELASTGIYARMRHPQYLGFILVITGFLLQWPTVLTLAMYPVLVIMYLQLARQEERQAEREFGDRYRAYKARLSPLAERQCRLPSMTSVLKCQRTLRAGSDHWFRLMPRSLSSRMVGSDHHWTSIRHPLIGPIRQRIE